MRRVDAIDVVETGYRIYDDPTAWLAATLSAASRLFDGALGALACFYDRNATPLRRVISSFVEHDVDPRITAALRHGFLHGDAAERDRSLGAGPVVRLSSLFDGTKLNGSPHAALARSVGFDDIYGVHAANPDGTGAFFGFPECRRRRDETAFAARWSRLAAHLAAGLRLHRLAQRGPEAASVVLDARGRIHAASGDAEPALVRLRQRVVALERARGRRERDAEQALAVWHALIEGRWSLVDHFDTDGKRYLLAIENAPGAPDPRGLTIEERRVLHYLAMGHANKLISYELGVPLGTIASRTTSILRKLGARSRTEVVDRYLALRHASITAIDYEASRQLWVARTDASQATAAALSPSERAVVEAAAAGESNRAIATRRGCSERTVANLLARAYRKLGVRSRAELALRLAG